MLKGFTFERLKADGTIASSSNCFMIECGLSCGKKFLPKKDIAILGTYDSGKSFFIERLKDAYEWASGDTGKELAPFSDNSWRYKFRVLLDDEVEAEYEIDIVKGRIAGEAFRLFGDKKGQTVLWCYGSTCRDPLDSELCCNYFTDGLKEHWEFFKERRGFIEEHPPYVAINQFFSFLGFLARLPMEEDGGKNELLKIIRSFCENIRLIVWDGDGKDSIPALTERLNAKETDKKKFYQAMEKLHYDTGIFQHPDFSDIRFRNDRTIEFCAKNDSVLLLEARLHFWKIAFLVWFLFCERGNNHVVVVDDIDDILRITDVKRLLSEFLAVRQAERPQLIFTTRNREVVTDYLPELNCAVATQGSTLLQQKVPSRGYLQTGYLQPLDSFTGEELENLL